MIENRLHAGARLAGILSLAAAALGTLTACGGGAAPTEAAAPRHASAVLAAAAATAISADQLMDWAQRTYPSYFPDASDTQILEPYRFRYYPSSRNYLGVAGNDVYVLGPVSDDKLLKVGTLEDFRCQVAPALCAPAASPTLVAGPALSAVLSSAGALQMWGDTAHFRLAAGTPVPNSVGRQVAMQVKQLAVGTHHALILDTEGRVFEYGSSEVGAASYGRDTDQPTRVPLARPAVQVQVSGRTGVYLQGLALLDNGTLASTHSSQSGPGGLAGLKDIAALSLGSGVPHAIKTDGTVIRLENSSTYGVFAAIKDATDVKQVSCSGEHCVALKGDGTVLVWGQDVLAMSRISDRVQRALTALPVTGIGKISQVAAGDGSTSFAASAAVATDGTLYTWGGLALGTPVSGTAQGLFSVTRAPALGHFAGVACFTHCLAVTDAGALWGWGADRMVITGNGSDRSRVSEPVQIGVSWPTVASRR